MLAEVSQLVLDELRRRGRDEHLPAVAGRGDAGGTMDVSADVALLGEEWRPRVQADPHLDRAEASASVKRRRRRERPGRGGESEEEGVSLRVDLDPALAAHASRIDAPVLGERVCVGLGAELVQQLRRALDVGEEEGDRAGREVVSHAP